MMFYFWVILLSILIGSTAGNQFPESVRETMQDAGKKCITENNLSPEVLQLKPGDFKKNVHLQKLVLCVLLTSGFGDESGHINLTRTAQFFPKEIQKIIEECDEGDEKDPNATATKFLTCFGESSPVQYTFS